MVETIERVSQLETIERVSQLLIEIDQMEQSLRCFKGAQTVRRQGCGVQAVADGVAFFKYDQKATFIPRPFFLHFAKRTIKPSQPIPSHTYIGFCVGRIG